MHVLGIDAGGTKTVCLLADGEGRVVAEARAGGANLQSSGELQVEKVLHDVVERALGGDDIRPNAICLGMAGVDRAADREAVRAILKRLGFRSRVLVVNDALIALVAGAGEDRGVVVIAGTGSIAYGRNGARGSARAGGWGYLLGDEGGGFWIGRAALAAVVREFDGRGPRTQLTPAVLLEMRLDSPADLVHAVYDGDIRREMIAGMASVVRGAADAGDAIALDILRRAAAELITAAGAVINALEMRGDVFRAVLAGGILRSTPRLATSVAEGLAELAPRSDVHLLTAEPAVGAVRLALAEARGDAGDYRM